MIVSNSNVNVISLNPNQKLLLFKITHQVAIELVLTKTAQFRTLEKPKFKPVSLHVVAIFNSKILNPQIAHHPLQLYSHLNRGSTALANLSIAPSSATTMLLTQRNTSRKQRNRHRDSQPQEDVKWSALINVSHSKKMHRPQVKQNQYNVSKTNVDAHKSTSKDNRSSYLVQL